MSKAPLVYQCQVNRVSRIFTILVALLVLIFSHFLVALGFAMGLLLCMAAFKSEYIEDSDKPAEKRLDG